MLQYIIFYIRTFAMFITYSINSIFIPQKLLSSNLEQHCGLKYEVYNSTMFAYNS